MASVVAVLVTTRAGSDAAATGDIPEASAYRIQANGLADILLESPGFVSGSSPEDWSDGATSVGKVSAADNLARLGLIDAQATAPKMLDYAKFQNLRAAPFAAAADGFVNYEEARETLGLEDSALDFHIRAYPSLGSVQDLLNCPTVSCKDPNLRVTYIGDIVPPDVPVAPPPATLASQLGNPTVTCTTAGAAPQTYRIQTTVTNNGEAGSPAVQFRAFFDIDFPGANAHAENLNGPLLNPGDGATLSIDVAAYGKRECASGTEIEVNLRDINGDLLTITKVLGAGETATTATEANKKLWLEAPTYFNEGQAMSVTYSGGASGNDFKSKPLYLVVKDNVGATVFQTGLTTPNNKETTSTAIPISTALTAAGSPYTATLFDGASASSSLMQVTERLVVLPAATVPGGFTPSSGAPSTPTSYSPAGVVESEVYFLHTLVQKFCPTYYDEKAITPLQAPTSIPEAWVETDADALLDDWTSRCLPFKGAAPLSYLRGDVYPDNSQILKDSLTCRMFVACDHRNGAPRYDIVSVLVVGSNVDHNELAPEEIKGGIDRWVRGGGTLIVFGGDDKMNWLMPILHTGTKSSSGGVSVPDAAHPILHVPDELDYPNYDHKNEVWDFRGSHDADILFTQVVAQGTSPDYEPILAISKPGAIQDEDTGTSGTVILTTWLPYDLFQGADPARKTSEGLKFVNNLLMMGYGDLYLDYGPPIPQGANVVPAVRYAQIMHPDFTDPVQLSLNVFVFASS
jgi:hypothetical protein